jgi:hypothetical protein
MESPDSDRQRHDMVPTKRMTWPHCQVRLQLKDRPPVKGKEQQRRLVCVTG